MAADDVVRISASQATVMSNMLRVQKALSWSDAQMAKLIESGLQSGQIGIEQIERLPPNIARAYAKLSGASEAQALDTLTRSTLAEELSAEETRGFTSELLTVDPATGTAAGGFQYGQSSGNTPEDAPVIALLAESDIAKIDAMSSFERQQGIADLAGFGSELRDWNRDYRPQYNSSGLYGDIANQYHSFIRADGRRQLHIPGRFASLPDTESFKRDLKEIIVNILVEHYKQLGIGAKNPEEGTSGTLLKAIQDGTVTMEEAGDNKVSFFYQMPNYERPQREDAHGQKEMPARRQASHSGDRQYWSATPSVRFYGPLVFQGRPPIVSMKKMVFKDSRTGKWVATKMIGASKPLGGQNIFDMNAANVATIASVIGNKIARALAVSLLPQRVEAPVAA